jgi:protein SCO1/2
MKRWLLILLCCTALARDAGSVYDLASAWSDQNGRTINLADLKGKTRVVVMFFSSCSYACPRITADLKSIESKLTDEQKNEVGFVMASFDVERDQPAVLKEFAGEKKLDEEHWTLLHGDEESVRDLAAVLGVRYRREPGGDFAHSNIITVLEPGGAIVHQREGLGGDLGEVVAAVIRSLDSATLAH